MVSRSLTEVFVLMRNNAIHSRQIFSEQDNESERVRLMRSGSRDIESGGLELRESAAPPAWSDGLEEAHYIITRLRTKLSELQVRHEKQLSRPGLDEGGEQRHITRLAHDIARLFTHAHQHIGAIRRYGTQGNKTEQKLVNNVVLALVTTLQDLSITFRTAQSNYLKSLTSREERSKAYLELPNFEELSLNDELLPGLTNNQTDLLFSLPSTSGTQNFIDEDQPEQIQNRIYAQKQMVLMEEENTRMVAQREEEVNKIVNSMTELNDIFKDLAHLVHEQGTVLDRIDYNIEQTQVQVQEGYKQLQKADRYQRKNRKMHCIMILTITLIILLLLLFIVKS